MAGLCGSIVGMSEPFFPLLMLLTMDLNLGLEDDIWRLVYSISRQELEPGALPKRTKMRMK